LIDRAVTADQSTSAISWRRGKRLKGCTARIVPNCSGFRKRNPLEPEKRPLRLSEIARVLVRFDHIARVVINASDGPMWVTPTAHDWEKLTK
jgi:hypothetical protein